MGLQKIQKLTQDIRDKGLESFEEQVTKRRKVDTGTIIYRSRTAKNNEDSDLDTEDHIL